MLGDEIWLAVSVPIHPKGVDGVEVRALCRPVKFFHTDLAKPFLALRFPFTGTKGPSPNYEKQPQTIIPPPPNFTVGTMHSGR